MSAPTADRPAHRSLLAHAAADQQRTLRTDRWWKSPLSTDLGLRRILHLRFVRANLREHLLRRRIPLSDAVLLAVRQRGVRAGRQPLLAAVLAIPVVASVAALALPFLLLFRLTCYYYRGAYYRAVWQSPPGCAVAEPHVDYTGETRFPLIIQNSHRYFFYVAVVISVINTYDAIKAFHSPTGLRIRFRQRHSGRQCDAALGVHAVVPLLPPHRRWAAQALLQAPGSILAVDPGQPAQHPAHAVRVDHAGHAGRH